MTPVTATLTPPVSLVSADVPLSSTPVASSVAAVSVSVSASLTVIVSTADARVRICELPPAPRSAAISDAVSVMA